MEDKEGKIRAWRTKKDYQTSPKEKEEKGKEGEVGYSEVIERDEKEYGKIVSANKLERR